MEFLLLKRGQTTTESESQFKKKVSTMASQVPATFMLACVKKFNWLRLSNTSAVRENEAFHLQTREFQRTF